MKYNKWEQYIYRNLTKMFVLDLDNLFNKYSTTAYKCHAKPSCPPILAHSQFLPLCVCSFLTMYLHQYSPVDLDVPTAAAGTFTAESDVDTTGSKTLSLLLIHM